HSLGRTDGASAAPAALARANRTLAGAASAPDQACNMIFVEYHDAGVAHGSLLSRHTRVLILCRPHGAIRGSRTPITVARHVFSRTFPVFPSHLPEVSRTVSPLLLPTAGGRCGC